MLALIIFVVPAVYFTAYNFNNLVKKAVEDIGSDSLQTEVRLATVDISLSEAKARLSGLTIHNPPGFSAENVITLNDVQFDLNPQAILDKTIDISEIAINGMQVTAEQKGATTNVQAPLNTVSKGGDKRHPDQEMLHHRRMIYG